MLTHPAHGCTIVLPLPDPSAEALEVLLPVVRLHQMEVRHCYPADPIC